MATLRLERAGLRNRGSFRKWRVFVDNHEVGVLPRWGDSIEVEVSVGTHVVGIKMFGEPPWPIELDFDERHVVDLLCGFGDNELGGPPMLQAWYRGSDTGKPPAT